VVAEPEVARLKLSYIGKKKPYGKHTVFLCQNL
jgi:hypothetical protein